MQLLEFFRNEDYELHFGSTASLTEYSAKLCEFSITTHELQLNDPSFDQLLKELDPTIVLFDRFISEEHFGWRVAEQCPKAIRILDTEDLHFLRDAREKAVKSGNSADKANLYTDLSKRELASIFRSDLSLIISEFEMELLIRTFNVPEGLLCYLPIAFPSETKQTLPGFDERTNFITIGNFQHAPNLDGIHYLATEIWPSIRRQLPAAELHIYGAYAPKQVSELHDAASGFIVKGWAPHVSEVMKNSRVCLAPLRFGAGLKGKILDALRFGTPVVTTVIGAEGIFEKPDLGMINDDPSEFINAAVGLYTSEEKWSKAQKHGIAILDSRFLWSKAVIPFHEKLNQIQSSLDSHRKSHYLGQVFQHQTLQSTKYLSKWIEQKNKL